MDHHEIEELLARALETKDLAPLLSLHPGFSTGRFEVTGGQVLPSPAAVSLTQSEAARIRKIYSVQPTVLKIDYGFYAASKGASAVDALRQAVSVYKESPNPGNVLRVENAINRLTIDGSTSGSEAEAIEQAIHSLRIEHPSTGDSNSSFGDDISCWLYEHADLKGRSIFADLPSGTTYKQIRGFGDVGLNDAISSLETWADASESIGYVSLFENDRFQGRYGTWQAIPGTTTAYNYVGDFMNDLTSSALIIRGYSNDFAPIPLSGGSSGFINNNQVDKLLASHTNIKRRGDLTITWDPWPSGPTSGDDPHPNDPTKIFVYVIIPITVFFADWFNYDAQIRYWINLFVNDSAQLQGSVDWYGAWVEGGVVHDKVLKGVLDAAGGAVGSVQARVDDAVTRLSLLGPKGFSGFYYLPGDNANTGNTSDGVTIVLDPI